MISTMKQNMEKLWMKLTQKGAKGISFNGCRNMRIRNRLQIVAQMCYNKENSKILDVYV